MGYSLEQLESGGTPCRDKPLVQGDALLGRNAGVRRAVHEQDRHLDAIGYVER
jgi:hypothetical protein